MSLPSHQLDAFFSIVKTRSFSVAAEQLHVTQSALSQRLRLLEETLGTSLIVRDPNGLRLTAQGERLLVYCQARESLESETLADLNQGTELAGSIRIAGFSTVMRSVVLPAITPFLKANPLAQIEFMTRELSEIERVLARAQAELVLLNRPLERAGLECHLLGYEDNVLIEPARGQAPENVYLDHDSEDTTTEEFFRIQNKQPRDLRRRFFDEIYAIMDGVASGCGRAVVPRHLADATTGIKTVRGYKPLRTPVYLIYFKQAVYSKLQSSVTHALIQNAPKILDA